MITFSFLRSYDFNFFIFLKLYIIIGVEVGIKQDLKVLGANIYSRCPGILVECIIFIALVLVVFTIGKEIKCSLGKALHYRRFILNLLHYYMLFFFRYVSAFER